MIRTIAIGLVSLALAACMARTVDTGCTAFQPIIYSEVGDTAETVTQVRQHNAAWNSICK